MFVFSPYPDSTHEINAKHGSGFEAVSSKNREVFLLQQEAEQQAIHISCHKIRPISHWLSHSYKILTLLLQKMCTGKRKLPTSTNTTYQGNAQNQKNLRLNVSKVASDSTDFSTIWFLPPLRIQLVWCYLENGKASISAQSNCRQVLLSRVSRVLLGPLLWQGATWDAISSPWLISVQAGIAKPSFSFQNKQQIARRQNFIASRISMRKEHKNKYFTT